MTYNQTYRILTRFSHAHFRRLLLFLRLTGCRPSEAASLRWSNIDWEKGIAVLVHHKTAKKTGEARTIYLTPVCIKLLRWIQAHPLGQASAAWLREFLRHGPRRLKDVATQVRANGLTARMLWRAKEAVGARLRRVGIWGRSYLVYELPSVPPPAEPVEDDGRVFTTTRGKGWNKGNWTTAVARARKRSGKELACVYTLRHRLATELCKRGTNLKVVAVLMGHKTYQTTMGYTEGIEDDLPLLQQVIESVNHGGSCTRSAGQDSHFSRH